MDILLVAATSAEIKPALNTLGINPDGPLQSVGKHRIKCLLTGVGMVSTAFELGKHLATHSYDLAINAGIAGSFDPNLAIGQVLHITDDAFADLGAEDGDSFLSIDDLGFGQSAIKPLAASKEISLLNQLAKARSITVNRVHGHETSIAKTLARLQAEVESMEGAAFFYACNQFNLPSIQIRSISNYVERRNREKWNIGLAVAELNQFLIKLLNEIA